MPCELFAAGGGCEPTGKNDRSAELFTGAKVDPAGGALAPIE
jgi:hypothetical protein